MNNQKKLDYEEKANETKTNISQNESHQPLNSDTHGNATFNLLNAGKTGNLFHKFGTKDKNPQPQQSNKNNNSKNSLNILQRRITANKEFKEDEDQKSIEEEKNYSSSKKAGKISSKSKSNQSSSLISENSSKRSGKASSNKNRSKHSGSIEEKKNQSKDNNDIVEQDEDKSDNSSKKNKESGSSGGNSDSDSDSSSKSDKKSGSSSSSSSGKSDSSKQTESKNSTAKEKEKSKNDESKEGKESNDSNDDEVTKKTEKEGSGDKASEQKQEDEEESEEEDDDEINNNKIENEEIVNRKLYKREKICDTDTEDEESENEKEIPWIVLPDNPYKKTWDLVIAFLILYSSIITPYEIAFSEKNGTNWFEILIDILLAIDIVLTFFSAYTDDEENLVKNHKKIIQRYLRSWFAVDLISVLPVSYFLNSNSRLSGLTKLSKLPKMYRLVKLTKLLRMTKMNSKGNLNRVTKFFMEKLKINANVERLFFFVLTFLLMNHLCACFWYFMAKIEDFSPDSWVVRLGYIDSSNLELYIISFYWTLTTVTTVGYGDITAGTTIERIYNLFIMSFGVLLYSFAIGSLSSIVSTLDQKSEEMNQKLQILSSIKKEFNLEQSIYDKVRKVIKYDLSRNQKDKMIFLQELPNKLRIELSQIMHDKVIQNFYFFRDQPSDFFAYVAPLLKPVKFSQNDYLYKCQDMIDEMYFVAKGTVIFCLDKKYGEKEIREIKKNNNFGEIEMCLNEKLSFNIKIKSRNCELFVLKKNDFLRLSVNFKEFIETFLHKSLMRYLKFNEEKNKMIREFDALMNITEGEENEDEEGEETSEEEEEEDEEEEGENDGEEKDLPSIDEESKSSGSGSGDSDSSKSDNKKESQSNASGSKDKKSNIIDSEKGSKKSSTNKKSSESSKSKNKSSASDSDSGSSSESKSNESEGNHNSGSNNSESKGGVIKLNPMNHDSSSKKK